MGRFRCAFRLCSFWCIPCVREPVRFAFPLLLVSLGVAACHHPAPLPHVEEAPPGQAWLTDKQVSEAKIEVAAAEEQNVDDTILTAGVFTFDDTRVAHIYSPVNGRVTQISATLGQRVKRGDPLAVIDSPDVGQFSADVGKAQADLIAAEHDFNRKKELFAAHACSQADYEQSEDNYRKAQAEIERARQKMRLLHGASGGMVSQGYALTSPIDGEVIARAVSPGVEVQGQYGGNNPVELFTVGELDRVWLLADVYEMDLARVKVGSKVSVKVVAYPTRAFTGKLDWISGTLDKGTRTIKVRCTFENPERLLKPEMYSTVSISVEERKALALPRNAVLRMGEQTIVFVEVGKAADGRTKFERRPVSIDEGEGSAWLPVEHGVEKGTRVVVSGGVLLTGMI